MTALQQLLDERSCVLERVTGHALDGTAQYAYVLLPKNRLSAFRQALAEREVAVEDFGVVLAHGFGDLVPEGLEAAVIAQLSGELPIKH